MNKVRESGENMKYLPEEVMREILLRLPVKSLLRLRSVSKSWRSLISDPLFAKSHYELASNAADRLVYLTASQTRSIDVNASFHDDSAVATLNCPITSPFHSIRILGSCRGFVLLNDWNDLFVWNPSTGSCKKLPYFPILLEYTYRHGFGYDSSNDDYLVAIASYEENADDHGTRIDYLSLKSNSWRKAEGARLPQYSPSGFQDHGIFLNGAIHWLAYRLDGEEGEVIFAFDLIQKNVRELLLPGDYGVDLDIYKCRILGGCLGIFTVRKFMTEIWIMKEYGVKSSWSKSIVVFGVEYFFPECFTKSGEIVGTYDGDGLVKRKHEGELLEHLTCGHDPFKRQLIMYTESLFALPNDIEGEGGVEDRQQ